MKKKFFMALICVTFFGFLICGCSTKSSTESLRVVESGFTYIPEHGLYSTAVIFENPNEDRISTNYQVRITAYDSNHNVLDTRNDTMPDVYPNSKNAYATLGQASAEVASVEFEILTDYGKLVKTENASFKEPLSLQNITVSKTKYSMDFAGEIVNLNQDSVYCSVLTVVFRDQNNNIIGGSSTQIPSVTGNGVTPCKITSPYVNSDIYELFVSPQIY